jgi:hypothetical protein
MPAALLKVETFQLLLRRRDSGRRAARVSSAACSSLCPSRSHVETPTQNSSLSVLRTVLYGEPSTNRALFHAGRKSPLHLYKPLEPTAATVWPRVGGP